MPKYGFDDDAWELAKQQARDVMAEVARQEKTITYSDLVARIGAIGLDQHSYAIRPFLNEVSTAEHDAGRGLITAVVVYRHGDHMPGPGFFDFALAELSIPR